MEIETLDDENNSYNQSTVFGSERASLNEPIPMTDLSDDNEKRADLLMTKKDTVYGSDVKAPKPIRLGKTFAFCYIKNQPLIIIGPHCKQDFS